MKKSKMVSVMVGVCTGVLGYIFSDELDRMRVRREQVQFLIDTEMWLVDRATEQAIVRKYRGRKHGK